ncbi:MAG: hypothetical protein IJE22_01330 [Oscillibacter sp.]|nr:hypothetical protein [Oscillibacter sp.]
MAGYGKSYSSYRGRTPKWKIILSIVLVLVIAVSVGYLALERYIVYDETGTPHFLLPGSTEQPSELPEKPHADLIVEEPEEVKPEPVQMYFAPKIVVTAEDAAAVLAAARSFDGAAVTVKAETGRVYFNSPTAISSGVESGTKEALTSVLEGTERTAAHLICFADPKAANSDVEGLGLKNTGGYIFYDGNNRQWMDPAKEDARAYLVQLAVECAQLGFDELILSDVGYPTVGKLHKIEYGETPQNENLEQFLKELTAALEPYEITLTLVLTADGILLGTEPGGLTVETAVKYADRICAATDTDQMENLATIVGRHSETVEFVPLLEQLPFGFEENAIVLPAVE